MQLLRAPEEEKQIFTMESRNCHAPYLEGGTDWPKVYNLSKIDMILFAGKLTFEPESLNDVYSTSYQPVQVAIEWLTRQLDSLNEEIRVEKSSSPRNNGSDQLVPPTLPLHMQGRAGVIEYEQIEKARLKRLKKLSRWRREQKREKRVMGARKRSSDESAHTQSTSSGSGSGSDSEPSRKRKRTPNPRYGSDFVCASTCKRVKEM